MSSKHVTPLLKDKRFLLCAATIAAVLWREPGEQVLTFLEIVVAAFMGQSQWGQTKRATAVPPEKAE